MRMHHMVTGSLDVNCYFIIDKGHCAVIDPADEVPVLAYLEKENLKLTHILLTHGHFDHIGGVAKLKEATNAKICIHKKDAPMLRSDDANFAKFAGMRVEPSVADEILAHNDELTVGDVRIRVLHTPGHTPGGVCYLVEDCLFTGDTLFRLSVGRWDFPGADGDELFASIKETLFALEGDYKVYPGHMDSTTLEVERNKNPFVRRYKGNR